MTAVCLPFKATFQFTPLREGRRPQQRNGDVRRDISIHAPPRGATLIRGFSVQSKSFQFTPLREGRRVRVLVAAIIGAISIHAPPRGATIATADIIAA